MEQDIQMKMIKRKDKKGFLFIGLIITLILFIIALAMLWVLGAKIGDWFTGGTWTKYLKWSIVIVLFVLFYQPIMAIIKFILNKFGVKM
jgi:hypothetical protein